MKWLAVRGWPQLRSAQISFVAPLTGPIEARARVLRRGKNATWISAELTTEAGGCDNGELRLHEAGRQCVAP